MAKTHNEAPGSDFSNECPKTGTMCLKRRGSFSGGYMAVATFNLEVNRGTANYCALSNRKHRVKRGLLQRSERSPKRKLGRLTRKLPKAMQSYSF